MCKILFPKYCDPHSILLVNHAGLIRRLFCPFQVIVIGKINDFAPGTSLWVEEVASNDRDELQYQILGTIYGFAAFKIKAGF